MPTFSRDVRQRHLFCFQKRARNTDPDLQRRALMPARTSLRMPKQKFELSSARLIGDMMDGASTPRQMRREGGGIESDGTHR